MQVSAYFQQIFFGLDHRTLESALRQVPDYLMPAIEEDRVRALRLRSDSPELRPISIVPENLFPSISPCRDVVYRTSKLSPRRS
jgi:hypothetical protein